MIFIHAAVSFGNDAVTEEPASLPEIRSSMIEIIVDRLDVRFSIPEIRDARRSITARRTDDKAGGRNERDAVIEIHDDGTNVIDTMTNEHDDGIDVIDTMRDEPARTTDQPAKGGEVLDESLGRTEERMKRNVNRIEVQCSHH